jgi:hypothetical protein
MGLVLLVTGDTFEADHGRNHPEWAIFHSLLGKYAVFVISWFTHWRHCSHRYIFVLPKQYVDHLFVTVLYLSSRRRFVASRLSLVGFQCFLPSLRINRVEANSCGNPIGLLLKMFQNTPSRSTRRHSKALAWISAVCVHYVLCVELCALLLCVGYVLCVVVVCWLCVMLCIGCALCVVCCELFLVCLCATYSQQCLQYAQYSK